MRHWEPWICRYCLILSHIFTHSWSLHLCSNRFMHIIANKEHLNVEQKTYIYRMSDIQYPVRCVVIRLKIRYTNRIMVKILCRICLLNHKYGIFVDWVSPKQHLFIIHSLFSNLHSSSLFLRNHDCLPCRHTYLERSHYSVVVTQVSLPVNTKYMIHILNALFAPLSGRYSKYVEVNFCRYLQLAHC